MSTIKMQQAYLAELRKTVLTAGNHSNAAYRAVSKALDGLSDMQFSAKASTVEELFTLRQRLDRLQHNGITYSQLIEEYADQLQAIDDGTNETSDTILSRLSSQTGNASTSRFSFSGAAKLAQQSATAGLFLGGAGLLSGITKIGKEIWDTVKGWFGKLTSSSKEPSVIQEPSFITNPESEFSVIRDKMTEPPKSGIWFNYDYMDGTVDGVFDLSCVRFSDEKLKLRGFSKNDTSNCLYGLDAYTEWKSNNSGLGHMASTTAAYLKSLIENQNNNEPLYNIYVTTGNMNHTALIDKAWIENGELKMLLSEHADHTKPSLAVRDTSTEIKGVHDIKAPKVYDEASLKSIWGVNMDPTEIYCFGLSQ